MSIKVNITQLQNKSAYGASIAYQLKEKANQINNIYYSLDSSVKSRYGIGNSMNSLQQRVEEAWKRVTEISAFLEKAAESYNTAEARIEDGPKKTEIMVGAAKVALGISTALKGVVGAIVGNNIPVGIAVAVKAIADKIKAQGNIEKLGDGAAAPASKNNTDEVKPDKTVENSKKDVKDTSNAAKVEDKTKAPDTKSTPIKGKTEEVKKPEPVAKPADTTVQKPSNSTAVDNAIKGVKGNATIILGQGCLSVMGFPIGKYGPNGNGVDASWGNMGKASTKLFQQMVGLEQTGELNEKTLAKMKECADKGLTLKELAKDAYSKGIRPKIDKNSTQAQRVNSIYFYALLDEDVSGVPAGITVAQAIQESNAGSSIPVDKYNGTYSYNMFGIKANSKWLKAEGKYVVSNTWEHINGEDIRVDAKFRAYNGFVESVADHSKFFKDNSRYHSLFNIKDDEKQLENWAIGLQKAGYATDPNYSKQLIKHINNYGLN